jgi:hypothetical protein
MTWTKAFGRCLSYKTVQSRHVHQGVLAAEGGVVPALRAPVSQLPRLRIRASSRADH